MKHKRLSTAYYLLADDSITCNITKMIKKKMQYPLQDITARYYGTQLIVAFPQKTMNSKMEKHNFTSTQLYEELEISTAILEIHFVYVDKI